MIYDIFAGNKLHPGETARSLKEDITFKKTIEAAVLSENFRFKKQQFELEDLRIMSLQSICNLLDHFKIADAGAFAL